MSIAQRGGEFGRKLAEPHAKKPVFVLVVALIILSCGLWAWSSSGSAKESADFLYWLGVILMVLGGIGLVRCALLFLGTDFE